MTGRVARRVAGGASVYPLLVLAGLNLCDELDRTAFAVLLPDIRDHFGLDISTVLILAAVVALAAPLMVEIPLALWADRRPRVPIALGGAVVWSFFTFLTGLAPGLVVLAVARAGAGMGRSVVTPTHDSLLSDYYDIDERTTVFAAHRAANAVGMFVGPLAAGLLASWLGWRAPFLLLAIPTAVVVVLGLRLREPVRGAHERRAAGGDTAEVDVEEAPAAVAEAWRTLWQVRTLRRIWMALPFLGASLIGVNLLTSLYYSEQFGMDERARGFLLAAVEPAQLVGLALGIPLASRLARRAPGLIVRFVAAAAAASALGFVGLALAPNVGVAVAANAFMSGVLALVAPGVYAGLSLAIPPRVRSFGFSVGSVWLLPGLAVLPIVGAIADAHSVRMGLLVMVPVLLIGAAIIASAAPFVADDVENVRRATHARATARLAREAGDPKMLIVRGLDVSYGQTQVLFGVDFTVDDGEVVALLGTNGAGKSTLLKAINGSVEPGRGTVLFDGADVTWLPADLTARRGVVIVPGGRGVFPTLTVRENLELAAWLVARDEEHLAAARDKIFTYFPVLRERLDGLAGNLSGGEQQMLTIGQALLARPRLLMIDELSLGLAPRIVDQLLTAVRAIAADGVTIILVEQSVNVALTIADRAVFMEKGEIRFDGPTQELLDRPDILRSVFLEGAGKGLRAEPASPRREPATTEVSNGLPAMEARDLTVRFGGITAVNGVNLAVQPGEILGLIGPNGAGKTTVFDALSGYVRLDDGRVSLNGQDATGLGPDGRARRGLGRSFQDARLFPSMTVSDVIAGALERHVPVRDTLAAAVMAPAVRLSERSVAHRVMELIDLMGLGDFADKFVSELSTGSRRMVDLACCLAHQPTVLLLDEPSSGIAQRETEALGPLLREIRDRTGAALLVIEHDMPLITSVSDRMLALELGTVIADGPPAAVINDEHVVASYLGTSEAVIQRSGRRHSKPRRRRAAHQEG